MALLLAPGGAEAQELEKALRPQTSYVFEPPEYNADLVVVLVPEEDYPGATAVDTVVKGRVLRIEKGQIPTPEGLLLIEKAGTLTAPLKRGVPVTLCLMKFRDREGYYRVCTSPAMLPPVSLALNAAAFRPGDFLEATVTFLAGSQTPSPGDLYIGARLPDGSYAYWVPDPLMPLWPRRVTGRILQPLRQNVPIAELFPYQFVHQFKTTEQPGTWQAFAILVAPGTDPLDPWNWIAVSTAPFTFTP